MELEKLRAVCPDDARAIHDLQHAVFEAWQRLDDKDLEISALASQVRSLRRELAEAQQRLREYGAFAQAVLQHVERRVQ